MLGKLDFCMTISRGKYRLGGFAVRWKQYYNGLTQFIMKLWNGLSWLRTYSSGRCTWK